GMSSDTPDRADLIAEQFTPTPGLLLSDEELQARHYNAPGTKERIREAFKKAARHVHPSIDGGMCSICEAREQQVARLEAENTLLRSSHDRYTEDGEPFLPRGWVPIDGGRYNELEAAEQQVEDYRAAI